MYPLQEMPTCENIGRSALSYYSSPLLRPSHFRIPRGGKIVFHAPSPLATSRQATISSFPSKRTEQFGDTADDPSSRASNCTLRSCRVTSNMLANWQSHVRFPRIHPRVHQMIVVGAEKDFSIRISDPSNSMAACLVLSLHSLPIFALITAWPGLLPLQNVRGT